MIGLFLYLNIDYRRGENMDQYYMTKALELAKREEGS